jgi:hypothetical protein
MSDTAKGMSRRGLIVVVAVAAVVLLAGVVVKLASGPGRVPTPRGEAEERPASPAVRAYFGDKLVDGSTLDRWMIVHVFDVREGLIPVEMATIADGGHFKVALLRRDPAGPRGVADTQQLSLFISNKGDGGTTTPEEQGQGIMALAGALTMREEGGAKPPALSTMAERRVAFPIREPAGAPAR